MKVQILQRETVDTVNPLFGRVDNDRDESGYTRMGSDLSGGLKSKL